MEKYDRERDLFFTCSSEAIGAAPWGVRPTNLVLLALGNMCYMYA